MLQRGADATLQIIIQGRGGQGAQLAGNVLSRAFFAEGHEVQSFATYGGARRGTPVSSFIRVDDKPIRVRCDIERADAILCFDASLLEARLLAAAGPQTLIVVNSRRTPAQFAAELPGYRLLPVDGIGVSQRNGLGRIVNSALLGALACALEAPGLDTLLHTVAATAPKAGAENGTACLEGYRLVEAQLALQAA
jgi:pyruvate ferredoxin oxidoreductase gamma subunit